MRLIILFLTVLLVAAGCASTPPALDPRSPINSQQVDLSGTWELRGGMELPVTDEQTIRMPRRQSSRTNQEQQRVSRPRRSKGPTVHLFLESGRVLKVSQTDYGVFASYDRAIVEEFNFGENRMVSIGPIEAQRVAGWDGPAFVIETMDREGNVLSERWSRDGDTLTRDISIVEGEEQRFQLQQVFDRR